MANGQTKYVIQDGGEFYFPSTWSVEEARRALIAGTGDASLQSRSACRNSDGSVTFARPQAGPKG